MLPTQRGLCSSAESAETAGSLLEYTARVSGGDHPRGDHLDFVREAPASVRPRRVRRIYVERLSTRCCPVWFAPMLGRRSGLVADRNAAALGIRS